MKTKLLLAAALLFATSIAFSQNLVLSHEGDVYEPNAEVSVEGPVTQEIVIELDVTNTGSATIDVLCQRYHIELVPGSMSALCWGGLCYPPNVGLSGFSTTIEPGQTVSNDFSGHYYPNGNTGMSTIAYTFFDLNNPNDSVMITVLFDGLTVGVEESSMYSKMKAFPNPANDFLTINLDTDVMKEDMAFELIDVNGSVVRETATSQNEVKINTSDLAEGIYFYRAMVNNKVVASEKIIIKH